MSAATTMSKAEIKSAYMDADELADALVDRDFAAGLRGGPSVFDETGAVISKGSFRADTIAAINNRDRIRDALLAAPEGE